MLSIQYDCGTNSRPLQADLTAICIEKCLIFTRTHELCCTITTFIENIIIMIK